MPMTQEQLRELEARNAFASGEISQQQFVAATPGLTVEQRNSLLNTGLPGGAGYDSPTPQPGEYQTPEEVFAAIAAGLSVAEATKILAGLYVRGGMNSSAALDKAGADIAAKLQTGASVSGGQGGETFTNQPGAGPDAERTRAEQFAELQAERGGERALFDISLEGKRPFGDLGELGRRAVSRRFAPLAAEFTLTNALSPEVQLPFTDFVQQQFDGDFFGSRRGRFTNLMSALRPLLERSGQAPFDKPELHAQAAEEFLEGDRENLILQLLSEPRSPMAKFLPDIINRRIASRMFKNPDARIFRDFALRGEL